MTSFVSRLHELFDKQKRFRFCVQEIKEISETQNGVYLIFEKGEKQGNFDRIVKVGTGQLPDRLLDHLQNNREGSSFRKHISRSLSDINEKDIEDTINRYVQNNCSFCFFSVDTKEAREYWESRIASTLAQSAPNEFAASAGWLGLRSSDEKIKQYRLWQVDMKEVGCVPLTNDEFEELESLISKQS